MSAMDESLVLSVVLLAKGENENLQKLVPSLMAILNPLSIRPEIIIVGAGKEDRPPEICERYPVTFLVQSRPGFGCALSEGIGHSHGNRILTMDSDLQHDPAIIPKMLNTDADIVIGSRWVSGQRIGLPLYRIIMSLGINIVFSRFLGIPVRDMSSNFRLYNRHVFDDMTIEGRNFDVLQEILIKANIQGARMVEVPMNFRERTAGESKVRLPLFFISYLITFLKSFRLKCYHTCK
jgi:glycosyltransferase involved in cell wall biosynthesis